MPKSHIFSLPQSSRSERRVDGERDGFIGALHAIDGDLLFSSRQHDPFVIVAIGGGGLDGGGAAVEEEQPDDQGEQYDAEHARGDDQGFFGDNENSQRRIPPCFSCRNICGYTTGFSDMEK